MKITITEMPGNKYLIKGEKRLPSKRKVYLTTISNHAKAAVEAAFAIIMKDLKERETHGDEGERKQPSSQERQIVLPMFESGAGQAEREPDQNS